MNLPLGTRDAVSIAVGLVCAARSTLASCGAAGMRHPLLRMQESHATTKRQIVIRGARTHNLQNVDLTLPTGRLIIITGVSGSGKSSLAFDTIYAEGQRRYVESLSAYARQFLERMEKPDVDEISGICPAIAIRQKSSVRNPRSTVGTVTEIYDYLRILYARAGTAHCPSCQEPAGSQTSGQIVEAIFQQPAESRLHVLAPVALARGEQYEEVFERARKSGFARAWVNGEVQELDAKITLDRRIKHDVAIVTDRLILREEDRSRLAEAVEVALREGKGVVRVEGLHCDEAGRQDGLLGRRQEVVQGRQVRRQGELR